MKTLESAKLSYLIRDGSDLVVIQPKELQAGQFTQTQRKHFKVISMKKDFPQGGELV